MISPHRVTGFHCSQSGQVNRPHSCLSISRVALSSGANSPNTQTAQLGRPAQTQQQSKQRTTACEVAAGGARAVIDGHLCVHAGAQVARVGEEWKGVRCEWIEWVERIERSDTRRAGGGTTRVATGAALNCSHSKSSTRSRSAPPTPQRAALPLPLLLLPPAHSASARLSRPREPQLMRLWERPAAMLIKYAAGEAAK